MPRGLAGTVAMNTGSLLNTQMDFIEKDLVISITLQARSWRKVIQVNMELMEVRRQTDQSFISLLQAVRVGR